MSSPLTSSPPIDYARPSPPPFDAASVTRPDRLLMRYYLITRAFSGPLFPLTIVPAIIRYKTLRYRFDDEGVSMRWGWVFRRETYLAYRRIQDIHVTRNLLHRWLGLSEVAIQTAAGSSAAEMKVEGIRNPEGVRDFLYSKMRGVRDHSTTVAANGPTAVDVDASTRDASTGDASMGDASVGDASVGPRVEDELMTLLTEIRDALRARDGGRPS